MVVSVIYEIVDIFKIKFKYYWIIKLIEGVIFVMGRSDIFIC